jgi:DNA-binding transcriptional LysR family regulator
MTHSPSRFDWDDLKHLLAVARHGSTLAAGRALGVDQSTVQRRLVELERRIGQSLVQRQPSGYRLTDFGQEMLPFAEAVERSVQAFERQLRTLGTEAAGVIRLTCPEPIVNRITQAGLLDRFHARHPALHVQFVMSDKYVDLAQGEAQVAQRSGVTEHHEIVGRKKGA